MPDKKCQRCKQTYKVSLKFGDVDVIKRRFCSLCDAEKDILLRSFRATTKNILSLLDDRPRDPDSPETSVDRLKRKINDESISNLRYDDGHKYMKRASHYKKALRIFKRWEELYSNEKKKLEDTYYTLLRDFKLNVAPPVDPDYPNPKKNLRGWLDSAFDADITDWIRNLESNLKQ